MDVEAPATNEEPQFFEPGVLTVTLQWHVVYKQAFRQFLEQYNKPEPIVDANDVLPVVWSPYQQAAIDIARFGVNALTVKLEDIRAWSEGIELATFLQQNYLTLANSVDEAVDEFVKDILHRYLRQQQDDGVGVSSQQSQGVNNLSDDYYLIRDAAETAGVHKKFCCTITSEAYTITVRELRCESIGQLVNLRGTATRLTDIRPELKCATFRCLACQEFIPDVEQQFKLTEPQKCLRAECKNRTSWELRSDTCQFADWQKLRLQENSSEIPAGSIPRAIDVILTRSLCDRSKPGDKVIITGCLAAIPDVPSLMKPGDIPRSVAVDRNKVLRSEYGMTDNSISGLKKLGARDLQHKLVFMAQDIRINNPVGELETKNDTILGDVGAVGERDVATAESRRIKDLDRAMTILGVASEQQDLFMRIARSNDTLDQLAKCMAPEIFGCENIKKGILLMIVGGVEKITGRDGLKLRGDINVCIVGDPGTAKSQLLKYVRLLAPRSVYASGNTSTAAGLTVSITKDPDQGDAVIEAGALMLADKGVCCIDEFDKMNIKDMIAIHEAMEQQTISICKGGVQATLNARASVLAACNPRYSRYDLSKPFRQNVRLSPPIISRFDLFFVMLDSTQHDDGVAWHIVRLHADPNATSVGSHGILSRELLKKYIILARSRRPKLTIPARNLLVRAYVGLRAESLQPGGAKSASVTVRSLESLIRLSEAIAKVKFAEEVSLHHVEEALRLVQSSLLKLERDTITLDDSGPMDGSGDADLDDERERAEEIVLDASEFERITSVIINKLRDEELESSSELQRASQENRERPPESLITKDSLITWYIENYGGSIEDTDETISREYSKIDRVIDRMITHDMSLIEEVREVESFSEELDRMESYRVTSLRLHPNYCLDNYVSSSATMDHRPIHATLSTGFFVCGDTGGEAAASSTLQQQHDAVMPYDDDPSSYAMLNDDDLLAEMYGWQPPSK